MRKTETYRWYRRNLWHALKDDPWESTFKDHKVRVLVRQGKSYRGAAGTREIERRKRQGELRSQP